VEFVRHVHSVTGRIHAQYEQIGAATGRISCHRPPLQSIPRDPAYRGCFQPAAGRMLVTADLSLIELCVAAELAGDAQMIAAINEGQDLHRLTAAALFTKPTDAVTDRERAFGKAVNFATLFGQGQRGLRDLARKHGLALSEQGARQVQQRFARAWPQLAGWRQRLMRGRDPVVRTASGRMRRLRPEAPGTVRANTPVQGTAADGFKAALARLWETRAQFPSAVPILAIHDELVVECDAQDADGVAAWVSACLQEGMQHYLKHVTVRVEVKCARDWSGTS
jgi:DNA polymerase-1